MTWFMVSGTCVAENWLPFMTSVGAKSLNNVETWYPRGEGSGGGVRLKWVDRWRSTLLEVRAEGWDGELKEGVPERGKFLNVNK